MLAKGDRLIDRDLSVRTKPMKILALGFPRTGTTSLTAALNQLGYSAYHMLTVIENGKRDAELWAEATRAKFQGEGEPYGRDEFDKLLADYDAGTDFPFSLFADELLKAYADAKVILTRRPAEKWIASMNNTVLQAHNPPLVRFLTKFDNKTLGPMLRMVELIFKVTHLKEGDAKACEVYEAHNKHVIDVTPANNLLIFEPPYEWKSLCDFLGVPQPEGPYPRVNDSQSFEEGHNKRVHAALRAFATPLLLRFVELLAAVLLVAWAFSIKKTAMTKQEL